MLVDKESLFFKLIENSAKIGQVYYNFCDYLLNYEGENIISTPEEILVVSEFIDDLCTRSTKSVAVLKFVQNFSNQQVIQELLNIHRQYLKEYNKNIKIFLKL